MELKDKRLRNSQKRITASKNNAAIEISCDKLKKSKNRRRSLQRSSKKRRESHISKIKKQIYRLK